MSFLIIFAVLIGSQQVGTITVLTKYPSLNACEAAIEGAKEGAKQYVIAHYPQIPPDKLSLKGECRLEHEQEG